MQIKNSTILITGANGGIGTSFVKACLEQNAKRIYVGARDTSKLDYLIQLDPDRVHPVKLDVTDDGDVLAAAESFKDVQILINNAGISLNEGIISTPDLKAIRSEIEVNCLGMMRMCRAFAPVLAKHDGGVIVNMLSLLAKANLPFSGSYSVSKAAALSMTVALRAELRSQKTLVIAVMPGTVDTDLAKDWPQPKVKPQVVVAETLSAIENEIEEVLPGDQAKQVSLQLLSDPKGVEKYMSSFLPGKSLANVQA